jgi:hypothetical protein
MKKSNQHSAISNEKRQTSGNRSQQSELVCMDFLNNLLNIKVRLLMCASLQKIKPLIVIF